MALCLPDSAFMSTHCTRANSTSQTGQYGTLLLSGFTPQATNATLSAPTKPLFQHAKFVVLLLDDNGNDNSDNAIHPHSHRSWLCHFSPLANPTRITLGDNGNISAASVSHIPISMCAIRQQTHTILLDTPQVHNLHGNLPSASHLAPCKGPDPAFAKVITPGARNTKMHIPMLTAHPLHTPESVRLCVTAGVGQRLDRVVSCVGGRNAP